MISSDNKSHWENVYETKNPDQVSWTQKKPQTSLDFIRSSGLGKDASIIDIGGGDSNLVDFLLEEGYENITVLDISAKALEKAQERLGRAAGKVKWMSQMLRPSNLQKPMTSGMTELPFTSSQLRNRFQNILILQKRM